MKHDSPFGLCIVFSQQSWQPMKGPRADFSSLPELYEDPECWHQQRLLGPVRFLRESRRIWVSISWFLDLQFWLMILSFIQWCSTLLLSSRLSLKLGFKKKYLGHPQWKTLGRFWLSWNTESLSSVEKHWEDFCSSGLASLKRHWEDLAQFRHCVVYPQLKDWGDFAQVKDTE